MSDIIISGLNKSYDEPVLINQNVEIKDGSIVMIYGASGSGKTTLLRIMMGLENPDSGSCIGVPAKKACVFQEDRLLENVSVLDNIKLVCNSSDEIIKKNLSEVFVGDDVDKISKMRVSELSGGMKRRVSIVRALMSEFDILFMDEPFKGLDDENKNRVVKYVLSNRNNKTLIIVSHDKGEFIHVGADKKIVLE